MFEMEQGVRQGGAISADLYKLYVNPLLNILCETGLGGQIGDIGCCAPTCADDVVIISNNPLELQILINIAANFSKREGYMLQPTKSVVLPISTSTKSIEIEEDFWNINNNPMSVVEHSTHIGIQKCQKNSTKLTAEENMKKARRSLYSLMGTGLHGKNGLDPETAITILNTYVMPILTYGLEILLPTGRILDSIHQFHKKMIKHILSLAKNTADPATNRAKFNKNEVPATCKVCCKEDETVSHFLIYNLKKVCCKEDETISHFLISCKALESERVSLLKSLREQYIKVLELLNINIEVDFIHVIINPFHLVNYCDNSLTRKLYTFINTHIEPACRTFIYKLNVHRYKLLNLGFISLQPRGDQTLVRTSPGSFNLTCPVQSRRVGGNKGIPPKYNRDVACSADFFAGGGVRSPTGETNLEEISNKSKANVLMTSVVGKTDIIGGTGKIVAAPSKYPASTPVNPQKTPEKSTMDVLREDLHLSDPEDSDDDGIYVKTTGPPKYSTNSYGYLVEEEQVYPTINSYKTYKGPVQSSSQQTVCRDELSEDNWMTQVTVRGIYNIFTSEKQ
ncbi:unnamed protein product [Mytilus coruscus]|uniref:Reverse transcriptase domain-containing protein n=1 Tax=Mytilus coruscus TaxID=42192 RepID=A0A6J8CXC9_MYTCO|nr:unnamed protein product [Mytilus coruscus]